MKPVKRIIVGAIILLLSATPVFAIAEINENTHMSAASTVSNSGNYSYSLGTLKVVHQPFWLDYRINQGATINFTRTPNTIFIFSEINGAVRMNFTVTVVHYMNRPMLGYFIKPRYTNVDYLYILDSSINYDYFTKFDEHLCPNKSIEEYTVYLPPEEQNAPLPTHGQSVNLDVVVWAGVGAGNSSRLGNDGNPSRFGRFLSERFVDRFGITIVPIPALNS